MMQFSVYYRHCGSLEICEKHIKYLQKNIPFEGKISILKFTDKQFGEIITFLGKKIEKMPSKPMQFELF
mgnify:FL=1